MTVCERMLALSLLEKAEKNPEYTKQIGLNAFVRRDEIDKNENEGQEKCLS